jgi:hypothetical protein
MGATVDVSAVLAFLAVPVTDCTIRLKKSPIATPRKSSGL